MGFFDNPEHRPPSSRIEVGDSVEGQITQLGLETNLRGALTLVYALDSGPKRWANKRLWRTMADARIDIGDRVRITRGPDEDTGGSMPATTWTVERLAPGPTQPSQPSQPQVQVPAW
jgi:hypothetical protein